MGYSEEKSPASTQDLEALTSVPTFQPWQGDNSNKCRISPLVLITVIRKIGFLQLLAAQTFWFCFSSSCRSDWLNLHERPCPQHLKIRYVEWLWTGLNAVPNASYTIWMHGSKLAAFYSSQVSPSRLQRLKRSLMMVNSLSFTPLLRHRLLPITLSEAPTVLSAGTQTGIHTLIIPGAQWPRTSPCRHSLESCDQFFILPHH